jgi:hypothetical protein
MVGELVEATVEPAFSPSFCADGADPEPGGAGVDGSVTPSVAGLGRAGGVAAVSVAGCWGRAAGDRTGSLVTVQGMGGSLRAGVGADSGTGPTGRAVGGGSGDLGTGGGSGVAGGSGTGARGASMSLGGVRGSGGRRRSVRDSTFGLGASSRDGASGTTSATGSAGGVRGAAAQGTVIRMPTAPA